MDWDWFFVVAFDRGGLDLQNLVCAVCLRPSSSTVWHKKTPPERRVFDQTR
ncbi:hypothetical protein SynMVIR181_01096 [Synechococcus sp. MVIR-18-1]|nr:hypothetical protein SynMVIR181_01096 [Synechococcus sp. MVIR-18-1]